MEDDPVRNDAPPLGELETQVMHAVWELQPCTEREITDRIQPARPVARTTVLKTIQRLEAKGMLRRRPGVSPVLFAAASERTSTLQRLIGRFVEGFLGGSTSPLVAYLAGQRRLSEEDVRRIRQLADSLEPLDATDSLEPLVATDSLKQLDATDSLKQLDATDDGESRGA